MISMPAAVAQFVAALFIVAAIIGAFGALGKALLYVGRVLHKANQVFDDIRGEPPRPGFPQGRPGLFDRMASLEATASRNVAALVAMRESATAMEIRLEQLEAQMRPNGGGSLRDVIDRTAAAVAAPVSGDRPHPPDGVVEQPSIVQQ